ncbi:unnamed protein product, partial [Symbiodinium sp. CCMP2456]
MASASAEGNAAGAATPVPGGNDDDLQEPPDPWRDYLADRPADNAPPGFSPPRRRRPSAGRDDLQAFEEFLRRRGAAGRPAGRRQGDDEDDGEDEAGGTRSNAGPPPQWDGTTPFRDYEIRARLWLATTKVKAKARGPSLLRSLSGTPFDDLKHLAKDEAWMQSEDNGAKLIQMMNTKELYGEDEREEYLGFLLVMALQVTPEEVKLMMNYTQGKLTQKAPKRVESVMMMDETTEAWGDTLEEEPADSESMEILLSALGDLDEVADDTSVSTSEVFDEEEAKEVLATMVREHSKGGPRRSFKA